MWNIYVYIYIITFGEGLNLGHNKHNWKAPTVVYFKDVKMLSKYVM